MILGRKIWEKKEKRITAFFSRKNQLIALPKAKSFPTYLPSGLQLKTWGQICRKWFRFWIYTEMFSVLTQIVKAAYLSYKMFPCRVPYFSMFHQKLACILFMCLQNFTVFSTRERISNLDNFFQNEWDWFLSESCSTKNLSSIVQFFPQWSKRVSIIHLKLKPQKCFKFRTQKSSPM